MAEIRIPVEQLPAFIQEEIAALDRDFAHLPPEARRRAVRNNLSNEAWDYLDRHVADQLLTLGPALVRRREE